MTLVESPFEAVLAHLHEAIRCVEIARIEADTDPPTGLSNRRSFDAALSAHVENLRRYGAGFGLLVIDVDRFKRLNLRWGHAAADKVLRRFANVAKAQTRAGDILARWGGDELAMIVEQTDEAGLLEVAERLREAIAGTRATVDGHRISLRVSVGGSVARSGDSGDDLFLRADRAMFAAKDGGGNRTVIDPALTDDLAQRSVG